MLSAKSGDTVYRATAVKDPKALGEFSCIHCDQKMSYVKGTTTSGRHRRSAHFRHPKAASHAVRPFSHHANAALEHIVEHLDRSYQFEIATDQIIAHNGVEYPLDLLVTEHRVGEPAIQTGIQVQSQGFKYAEMEGLMKGLNAQGAFFLPILVAKDPLCNATGKYLRKELRDNGQEVVNMGDNELALTRKLGFGAYFLLDEDRTHVLRFADYHEILDADVRNRHTGRVVKEKGSRQDFVRLRKIAKDRTLEWGGQGVLRFDYVSRNGGLNLPYDHEHFDKRRGSLIAVPRLPNIHDSFHTEALAQARGDTDRVERVGEGIARYLHSCDPKEHRRLTELYGAHRLGGFAVHE